MDIVKQGLRRRAEQEYLMMNMEKGAMWDAAQVADEFKVGIAVRGTGLLAHMGIESGDPTKAQEFKNKTSKEIDLILCEEMEWSQLGAVVHYDPRANGVRVWPRLTLSRAGRQCSLPRRRKPIGKRRS